MRKTKVFIAALIMAMVPLFCCQQQDEKIREEVSVVNVEVPVRVFYKGKAVDNLSKKDFKLYEDGKLQSIHGFFKHKRKIDFQQLELEAAKGTKIVYPPRYFVLVFRITDFNRDIKKGLDYIYGNILKKNDQLLVFVNDKTLFINTLTGKEKARSLIDQALREESLSSRQLMSGYLRRITQLLERFKTDTNFVRSSFETIQTKLLQFMEKYLQIWREYKRRYLVPDMDKFYNFARFLEKIRLQKWVISFYQVEMFPKLRLDGQMRRYIEGLINSLLAGDGSDIALSRRLRDKLTVIDRELNAAEDFPAEEVSKLFYRVGATFHSILMTVQKEAESRDFEFKRIATDIENSLREITKRTGGKLMATNDLKKALDIVVDKEDITYMLTYYPENPNKTGKIKVEVSNNKYRVIYDKNLRAGYFHEYLAKKEVLNPEVRFAKVSFKDKKLSLVISNFLMKKKEKEDTGLLNLHIRVKDNTNKILFDKAKNIAAKRKEISLSLGFDWLQKGEYSILMDVKDLLTGKSSSNFFQPVVK